MMTICEPALTVGRVLPGRLRSGLGFSCTLTVASALPDWLCHLSDRSHASFTCSSSIYVCCFVVVMSFGFSASDFALAVKVSWKVYTALRDATDNFKALSTEVMYVRLFDMVDVDS